jgi:cytochrome c
MRLIAPAVLALTLAALPASAQDAAKGATLFKQRCAVCHQVDPALPKKLGPHLKGVVGRPLRADVKATYSAAMKKASHKWDEATLDAWLENPGKLVPGSTMVLKMPKPEERKDILAYLKTVK